ncbi:NADH-quinone oxidoreductase subunit N [Desulfococcus sp.]|uniref:NADH-quinone oxidoreductase subunit N n=1 Tax=Desulfococcus sp. TaxID=2025834 RepID=UPI003D11374C
MNWMIFSPEICCLVTALVFLFLAMAPTDARRDYIVAVALTGLAVCISLAGLYAAGELFHGTYRVDLFSQVFKSLLLMGLFLVVFISSGLSGIEHRYHPEYYMLLSICTLAMMMLVSAVHILTLYVALELSSYSLYILVFLRKGRDQGVASGMKFFLIGASASATMLLGLALLYGATNAAYFRVMVEVIPGVIHQPEVILGLALALSGFLFKMAVFPFHFWAPDVYEGAAHQVAAYISTASKVAVIAVLLRMVALSGGESTHLVHFLAVLAIISMTVGNLTAIAQKDLKRLLAFSSIAHAGYVLVGILCISPEGNVSAMFYAVTVLLLKFTCFLVVIQTAFDGENIDIDRLAGLHRRSPIMALALMTALFGLAGIPPTIGFTGKLLIFVAAMEKGYFALVLIAMFNVVISLYYYLLVVRAAYLLDPPEGAGPLPAMPGAKILAGALVAAIVILGIYPTPLLDLIQAAATALG